MEVFIHKIKSLQITMEPLQAGFVVTLFVVGTSIVNHLFQVCSSMRNTTVLVLLGKERFSFKTPVLTDAKLSI